MMDNSPTYRIVTVLQDPYVMVKEDGGYEGFMVDLLDKLSEQVGFKYNLHPTESYGSMFVNRTWSGIMGQLTRGESDVAAAALKVTSIRERFIDFTKPFMTDSLQFLVLKPKSLPVSLDYLLQPLSHSVWICILIALVIVALLFMLIGRFNPYEWRQVPSDKDPRGAKHSFGLRESLMFVFSTLTLQGYRETPRSLAGRVLTVSWFIFVFLTIVTYISNVIAFNLAGAGSSVEVVPFESLDDLVRQRDIKVGIIGRGSTARQLKNSKVAAYKRLSDFIRRENSYVRTTAEGVKRVLESDGRFVMFMESSQAEYIAGRNCELMVYGVEHFPTSLALATGIGSPLRDTLSLAILELQENQVIQMLRQRWWHEKHGGGRCISPDAARKSGSKFYARIVNLRDVAAPFLILLGGAILSAIVLVGEVLFKKLRQ